MYSFFITVHAQPDAAQLGPRVELAGRTFSSLAIGSEQLSTTPLSVSFEDAAERLGRLERMYCELDGSFVWVSSQGEPSWQIDGNLYDRDGRLLFVDLKGTCPPAQFNTFLTALGWPATKLMFQLTREAIFLGEAEFRRHAAGAG